MDNRSDDLEIDGFGAEQIRGRLSNVEIHLAATDIEVDIASAFRLPLDQVAALGGWARFSSDYVPLHHNDDQYAYFAAGYR